MVLIVVEPPPPSPPAAGSFSPPAPAVFWSVCPQRLPLPPAIASDDCLAMQTSIGACLILVQHWFRAQSSHGSIIQLRFVRADS